jgi:hypothetical protein
MAVGHGDGGQDRPAFVLQAELAHDFEGQLAMAPASLKRGIEKAEFSWILESNRLSYGSLEKGGATIIKRYRVYGWQTDDLSSAKAKVSRAPRSMAAEAVGQLAGF